MSLSKVRLSTEEIEAIKRIIRQYDEDAQVFLFGSRTDPEKKGGDIDLIVISQKIDDVLRRKIKVDLFLALGDRKIDLIVTDNPYKDLFTKIMIESGIKL